MEPGETAEKRPMPAEDIKPAGSALSAAQRRAEIRRRKLLQNSEDRMNRIVGKPKSDTENNGASRRSTEPRFHLDLDGTESWQSSSGSPRASPFLPESGHSRSGTPDHSKPLEGAVEDDLEGFRQMPRGEEHSGSPRRGLQKYLSRFDDAMKLRGQLANEKPVQDAESDAEEFDTFRIFRLIGSVLLAVFVRVFVCKYLSIFAPFLTLELAYMGLSKYFPKTVLPVGEHTESLTFTSKLCSISTQTPRAEMSRDADVHEWASRLMFDDNGDNFPRSNRNLDLATEPITLWMLLGQDVESGNGDAATNRLPRTSNTASLDASSESSSDLGEEELAEDTLTSDVACSAEDEPEPLDQSFSESSFEPGLWSSESFLHLQSLFDQTPVHLSNVVQQPTSGHPTNKPKDVGPKVKRRKGLC